MVSLGKFWQGYFRELLGPQPGNLVSAVGFALLVLALFLAKS